jgi:hypothetical protein
MLRRLGGLAAAELKFKKPRFVTEKPTWETMGTPKKPEKK